MEHQVSSRGLKDGFRMMEEDHCMYLKHSNNGFVILSLYVDNILLARNSKEIIDTDRLKIIVF